MFSLKKTKIDDCFLLEPPVHKDQRGLFVKSFHKSNFKSHNMNCEFKEDFYTVSQKDVIRVIILYPLNSFFN